MGRVIALVGAPGARKCLLAQSITAHLQAHGISATHVAAPLAERSRPGVETPQHKDCAALAAARTRRIDAAAAHGIAVADTTALMTAIDCDLRFADASLYADALAAQRRYTLTLLAAPDLADAGDRADDTVAIDTRIRASLTEAGVPFTVIHGQDDERLITAWNALRGVLVVADTAIAPHRPTERADQGWTWSCDTCSDPACEHRLFSDLVAGRR